MSDPLTIAGLCLGGYRSFGLERQFMGPFGKVNLFAGPNNSGKSNILRFLYRHLPRVFRPESGFAFEQIDRPLLAEPTPLVCGLALDGQSQEVDEILSRISEPRALAARHLLQSERIFRDGLTWFIREASDLNQRPKDVLDSKAIYDDLERTPLSHGGFVAPQLRYLRNELLSQQVQGGTGFEDIPVLLNRFSPFRSGPPSIELIDAFRRVTGGDEGKFDHSGLNLIRRLAELQNPDHHQQERKQRFASIERFLQDVMERPLARLEIPYLRNHILVHSDGKTLPLDSLGTGIHEVVILAAAATVLTKTVVCIEEPEVHLHPVYQRKLVQYLQDQTDNQYFIATHSPHLLDMRCGNVFQVAIEDGWTKVRCVDSSGSRWDICRALGARPSDVVQANCLIWVEGPSDRIYLNHWLHSLDSELVEGVHYSIVYYGGKVLTHFSADDPEFTDLVSLLAVNRNPVLIADSDKSSESDSYGETKARIEEELNGRGLFWITAGREIENYISPVVLSAAIKAVNPSATIPSMKKPFGDWLPKKINKVKLAKEVVSHSAADPTQLNLGERMAELQQFIRNANHMRLPQIHPSRLNEAGSISWLTPSGGAPARANGGFPRTSR